MTTYLVKLNKKPPIGAMLLNNTRTSPLVVVDIVDDIISLQGETENHCEIWEGNIYITMGVKYIKDKQGAFQPQLASSYSITEVL